VQNKSKSNRRHPEAEQAKVGSNGGATDSPASTVTARPKKGLGPDAALKHWSDKAAYSELMTLSGEATPPAVEDAHKFISDVGLRREYSSKREAIEVAFREKLIDREILASGIASFGEQREVMPPSIWELLEIDYGMFGDAVGEYRKYEKLEFFEPSAVPLNIRSIPDWLAEDLKTSGYRTFEHDPDYRHVTLNGIAFTLGPIQSRVVELLHQAAIVRDPWLVGPTTLEKAGSEQRKMVDAFKSCKDWRLLIDSDGRGMYRLRFDSPQDREE